MNLPDQTGLSWRLVSSLGESCRFFSPVFSTPALLPCDEIAKSHLVCLSAYSWFFCLRGHLLIHCLSLPCALM